MKVGELRKFLVDFDLDDSAEIVVDVEHQDIPRRMTFGVTGIWVCGVDGCDDAFTFVSRFRK